MGVGPAGSLAGGCIHPFAQPSAGSCHSQSDSWENTAWLRPKVDTEAHRGKKSGCQGTAFRVLTVEGQQLWNAGSPGGGSK